MGLKSLQSLERVVETPGGPLSVRGISLDDVVRLVRRHRPVAAALFDQMMAGGINLDDRETIGATLLDQSPDLAAEIIALGTGDGDEESIGIAKSLPFPLQLELLDAVSGQTFTTDASSKKVIETIGRVLQGLSGTLTSLSTSPIGSEVSGDK